MHLNFPLCLSFLGTLVSFSSVSARTTYGHQLQLGERDADLLSMRNEDLLDLRYDDFLDIRDEDHLVFRDEGLFDIRDVEDLYESLVRRAPKKTPAQAAAIATRKANARTAATRRGKGTTPKGQQKTAKHIATQKAANARKQAKKKMVGFPHNDQKFKVPGRGGSEYDGREVRKAAWQGRQEYLKQQAAVPNGGPVTGTHLRNAGSPLKTFGNFPNRKPKGNGDPRPLPHMSGPGYESRLPTGPGRVITQQNSNGQTVFQGVVSHDPGRKKWAPSKPGRADHFQVQPTT